MRIMHVTVFAKDVDASVKFYQEVAGLSIVRDLRGGDHSVVFLNDGTQDFCFEIAQGDDQMQYSGTGVSLGLASDDLDAERERLESMGIKVGETISPNPFVKFFFIPDPDGFLVQFVQEGN